MKALITVGYGCNNRCGFCHTAAARDVQASVAEVDARIDRAAGTGHTMVVLTGGEPTMRPEILRWAARAADLGMDLGLVTNGRMLAYPGMVEKLIRHGLRYVHLALHGGTAEVHDRVVRAEAFAQTFQALRNLTGRGLDLTVGAVVTYANVEHLRALVDAVLPFPDVVLKLSMARPGDGVSTGVVPEVAHAAQQVREAIAYGATRAAGHGPAFTHEGFPLCLLPGQEDRHDDPRDHGFATHAEVGDADLRPVDDRDSERPEATCGVCSLRGVCPGVPRGYREIHGDPVLYPVTGRPQSNSFNYTLEGVHGVVTGATHAGCPVLRDGVVPWDRGRVIFVRRGERVARFRTVSRDFTGPEIAVTKHTLGQVYLDVSQKPAPDDFPRDLVQLRRSERCGPCPARDGCAGLYDPVPGDPFTRDDARVRALLAGLTGDVLDVGCGEGPYEDLLAGAVARGVIRYVGIDPDGDRVTGLRARWPWADVRLGTAEDLAPGPGDGERFDHVLVLRSWNHLRDPARAVAGFARRLRPGGSLTVVDNVAFGLVRTRTQTVRAEGGPAAFEHYRNDGAAEAVRVLVGQGFTRVEQWDVGVGTSNQWLLRCRLVPMSGDSRPGPFGL